VDERLAGIRLVARLVAGAVADGRGAMLDTQGRSVRKRAPGPTKPGTATTAGWPTRRCTGIGDPMSGLTESNTTEDRLSSSETVCPGASGNRLGLGVSADVRPCEACRGNSRVYNSRLKAWIVCSVCRGSGAIDDRPPRSPDWYADYAPSDVPPDPPRLNLVSAVPQHSSSRQARPCVSD
jgi:hypothetical protein